MTSEERKRLLLDIADALEANSHIIHVENQADVCEAEHASLISRLALNPGKASEISLATLARADCVQCPHWTMCLCFSKNSGEGAIRITFSGLGYSETTIS